MIRQTIHDELLTRVDKPALLRRLFQLGCAYSGQILSYQKMLGQLTDAGNTTTLAHYLELLRGAGMLAGLSKYARGQVRQRGSSPKLQILNTALMSAQDHRSLKEARVDGDHWGRLVESCIGAHLLNSTLTWQSVTNRSYFIERAASLAPDAEFQMLRTNIQGQANTTSIVDTNPPAATPAFYRVGIQTQ